MRFGSGRDGNVMPSPRDKEKKKITLRITSLGSYEDTEDSTSDEDDLHGGLTRNFMDREY